MSEGILVIGGTGTTGSRVARLLAERNIPVAVGTRRPSEDHHVRFDWADPASAAASENVRAAYLVAPTDRIDHLSVMRPILERASGLKAGTDFHLAFSPERIDPGSSHSFTATPKLVAGVTDTCTRLASQFYSSLVTTIVVTKSPREAEMAKLIENTFRQVNIALIN